MYFLAKRVGKFNVSEKLILMNPKFRSILSASQFTKSELSQLLDLTSSIENKLQSQKQIPLLNEYILATMFFEPSTRTRLSFESAMHRLGGRVITAVGMQFSSMAKGETLFDTLKVLESYADICAIRHPVEGASALAAQTISIPVINAGDGAGEHPTQGLLDLYTIAHYKKLDEKPLNIGFVGDIKYGRTIHSLIQLLSHFDCHFTLISPKELQLDEKYISFLKKQKKEFLITEDLNKLSECDVAYVTRIQEERFIDHREFEKFHNYYIIDKEVVEKCKKDIIIMHPMPRLSEISTDVDDMPQAKYFHQAKNGLFTRMALLLYSLNIRLK